MLAFYLSMIETENEKDKFERLYHQYGRLMKYTANKILHDDFLAEDAVHTAFLKIISNLHKIDENAICRTKGFVIIITENAAKSMYVNRKKIHAFSSEYAKNDVAYELSEFEKLISDLSADTIADKIGTLSKQDSEILMLRYIHELTDKEISRLLDLKESTVRKRLERARRRLAETLEKEGCYCG